MVSREYPGLPKDLWFRMDDILEEYHHVKTSDPVGYCARSIHRMFKNGDINAWETEQMIRFVNMAEAERIRKNEKVDKSLWF